MCIEYGSELEKWKTGNVKEVSELILNNICNITQSFDFLLCTNNIKKLRVLNAKTSAAYGLLLQMCTHVPCGSMGQQT